MNMFRPLSSILLSIGLLSWIPSILLAQQSATPSPAQPRKASPRRQAHPVLKSGLPVPPPSALQVLFNQCRAFEAKLPAQHSPRTITTEEEKSFLNHFVDFLSGTPDAPVFTNGKLRPEAAALYDKFPQTHYKDYPSWLVLLYRQALADNHDTSTPGTALFPKQVKDYGEFLASLDKTNPATVAPAIACARQHYAQRAPFLRDAAYFQFRGFWDQVCVEQTLQLRNFEARQRAANPRPGYQAILTRLKAFATEPPRAQNGFSFGGDESVVLIQPQPSFFVDHFAGFVSASVLDFLKLEQVELNHPLAVEGHLSVSVNELARRIVTLSDYLARHPHSPCRADVDRAHTNYLMSIYLGATRLVYPTIWVEDRTTLDSQFKRSYEAFIQEYPNTADGHKVAAFYAILKHHNFTWSAALEREMKADGFEVRPPPKPIRKRYRFIP